MIYSRRSKFSYYCQIFNELGGYRLITYYKFIKKNNILYCFCHVMYTLDTLPPIPSYSREVKFRFAKNKKTLN